MSFTHLQVRTGYSLMKSAITIEKLIQKAKELNFTALALTDENVLYGAIPFYQTCKKYGIKPVIGMTVSVLSNDSQIESCILLAKNNNGYKQLIKLSTAIQMDEQEAIPREKLLNFTNDVIGILPVFHSHLKQYLISQSWQMVHDEINVWKQLFHAGDFYLGIQNHGLEEEQTLNRLLKQFLHSNSHQVVAINDVRYLEEQDVTAYSCLQAVREGKRWTTENIVPSLKRRHLRSQTEMEQFFIDWPNALAETEKIQAKCQITLDFTSRKLPSYPLKEKDADTYLRELCASRLKRKYTHVTDTHFKRLDYELNIIQEMNYSDYFLIVWDFIKYAKENGILVGPGRGSSAGSLVAYVLDITEIDPLEHELLFERFLNPERVSMPDIDVDFSDHRRDEVINYVRTKYGQEHVAQIITFGTFLARSLIRELIKTMGINQQDAAFILKNIPVQSRVSLKTLVNQSEMLKQYIKQSKQLTRLFSIGFKLEGLPRHTSTHAAGVVISDEPLTEYVPLTMGTSETALTQYTMNELEAIGLVKFDFLGLRNLTLLERIIQSIEQVYNRKINLTQLPSNDEKTFRLLQQGKTNGIFQLESKGMKQVLTKLKPTAFQDIVAVNALYRPGPMEYIATYINRKYKRENVDYPHQDLQPILKSTYGVLIYQEQIMQIAHDIAGFSLGQADLLRRAISKKNEAVMLEQKEAFIEGCQQKGYDPSIGEKLFTWIVKFSAYGFPKSHAVAYSKISYQLAYLKAHYPASFFAELLSSVGNQQEKVHSYIKEMKEFKIHVLPPSINHSFAKYTVEKGQIRIGLLAIKGIGMQTIKEIIQSRKDEPFQSLFDFCLRVSNKIVNRPVLEMLILAGAFDELYNNRASLLASVDQAMELGELFREFRDQPSLFPEEMKTEDAYVEIEDFSQMKKLADEKELLGMYVSSHPLKNLRNQLSRKGYVDLNTASRFIGKKNIKAVVIVQAIKKIRTKRGDSMAFLTIGDEVNDMEAVVFPNVYREINRWLTEELPISITGKVELRNNRMQWVVNHAEQFDLNEDKKDDAKRLFIRWARTNEEEAMKIIRQVANDFPGTTRIIIFHEKKQQTYLLNDYFVEPTQECLTELKKQFGEESVVLT